MYRISALPTRRQQVRISIVAAVGLLCVPAMVFGAASSAISQSFNASTGNIMAGTILSLQQGNNGVVEPANSTINASNLEGVAADKPLVELSSDQQNSVQVVVGGITPALVSDINGTINAGDQIAPSPISGIGMKATTPTNVIGTAQTSLGTVTTVNKTVTSKSGKQVTIKVGLLPISVDANYYSDLPTQSNIAAYIPPYVQNLANKAANGRSVPPLRVFIGSIGLFLGFMTILVMIYTSLRSGMISMGRNPLAEKALRRGLIDILVAALGIFVVTVATVYIVITK